MGIYNDENWHLDENHWMLRAARWAGSHHKLLRRTLLLLMLMIVGGIVWSFINN